MPESIQPLAMRPAKSRSFQGASKMTMAAAEWRTSRLLVPYSWLKLAGSSTSLPATSVALVGIPVHGVRVGVVGMEAQAAAAVARDLDHGRFIGRVGAARDLGDLLVVGIEAAALAGRVKRRAGRTIRRTARKRRREP